MPRSRTHRRRVRVFAAPFMNLGPSLSNPHCDKHEWMIRAERDPALRARVRSIEPLPGVRAGSALLWAGGRLLVVQDDALAVAWIDLRDGGIEHVVLEGHGEALPKGSKPDFEAAFEASDG